MTKIRGIVQPDDHAHHYHFPKPSNVVVMTEIQKIVQPADGPHDITSKNTHTSVVMTTIQAIVQPADDAATAVVPKVYNSPRKVVMTTTETSIQDGGRSRLG